MQRLQKVMASVDFDSKIQTRTVIGQFRRAGILTHSGPDLILTDHGKEWVIHNSFIVNARLGARK